MTILAVSQIPYKMPFKEQLRVLWRDIIHNAPSSSIFIFSLSFLLSSPSDSSLTLVLCNPDKFHLVSTSLYTYYALNLTLSLVHHYSSTLLVRKHIHTYCILLESLKMCFKILRLIFCFKKYKYQIVGCKSNYYCLTYL
jgi:hypothetical protein